MSTAVIARAQRKNRERNTKNLRNAIKSRGTIGGGRKRG